jgi:hypothetical protein
MTHARTARARRAAGRGAFAVVAATLLGVTVTALPAASADPGSPAPVTPSVVPAVDAPAGAALDGAEQVPHQPFAKVPPIGATPPKAATRPFDAIRGTAMPTVATVGLSGQSLELVMRTPNRALTLKTVVVDLPASMTPSYLRAGVRLDGPPPRDLAVASVTTRLLPAAVSVRRGVRTVVPAHRRLVITLKASVVLGRSVALRVWVSRFRNPGVAATYAVPVTFVALRGVPSATGSVSLRIEARPSLPCPTARASNAIARENARPGSNAWTDAASTGSTLAGYASRSSVSCGDSVALRVDSSSPWFTVWAFRMGGYGSKAARLVWRSGPVVGTRRVAPVAERTPNGLPGAIEARWPVSLTMRIGGEFVPGVYLLQVRGSDGGRTWIPLVVKDSVGTPRIAVVLSTFTWQSYNTWGGASAYGGLTGEPSRSRVVSFERPYRYRGDGGFMTSEWPFVRWAETQGYDVTYLTDEDLNAGAGRLRSVAEVVFPAHAEYWTAGMRAHLQSMVLGRGGNVAFLGANNMYWRPRLVASPFGPGRRLEMYRYATEDPQGANAAAASVRWRETPISNPEQQLLGSQYACLGVDVGLVVPAVPTWPFPAGVAAPGTVLDHLGHGEIDRVWPGAPLPGNVRALAQAPVTCSGGAPAGQTPEWDVVAYATPQGGAVLNLGTLGWTCQLTGSCWWDRTSAQTAAFVRLATATIVTTFARGPAGATVATAGVPWTVLPGPSPTPTPTPSPTDTSASPTPTATDTSPTPTPTDTSPTPTDTAPSASGSSTAVAPLP